jgi:DNA-binding transcriptional regulator of glucitol operon
MSIKAFHLVFVISAIALCAFLAWWCIHDFRATGNLTNLAVGLGTVAFGALLVVYSFWFVRKIRSPEFSS